MNKKELILAKVIKEIRDEYKDTSNEFNKNEISSFLNIHKKKLAIVISNILPGNHGLLRLHDILDIDNRFYEEEARLELMHFANPLFVVHSLIDYHSIGVRNMMRDVWAHDVNQGIITASIPTLMSMKDHGIEIFKLLLKKIYNIGNLLNRGSCLNSIVNIILGANDIITSINGRSIIVGDQYNIIANYNLQLLILMIEHGLIDGSFRNIKYFDLIEGGPEWHYSSLSTEQVLKRINDKSLLDLDLRNEPLKTLRTIPYLSTRESNTPTTLYYLCESDPEPHLYNPQNIISIRKMWDNIINLQKAQQNLSFAKGYYDPKSILSSIPEKALVEKVGINRKPTRFNKHTSKSLRRQTIGKLSDKKDLFDAYKRLETAKLLFPNEDDDNIYLEDKDVSNKIIDGLEEIDRERGIFSESKINKYFRGKKNEDQNKMKRLQQMMVPNFPSKVDMELYSPLNFDVGMKVTWNTKNDKYISGIIDEIQHSKYAVIVDQNDKKHIKRLTDLQPAIDQNYLNELDGGSRKTKTRKKKYKKL